MSIPEAPTANIQPLRLTPSDQILRIEGRELRRDAQVPKHNVADILRAMHRRAGGRAVLRRRDGWWEMTCHLCGRIWSTSCDRAGSYIALRGWEDVSRGASAWKVGFVSRWTLLGLLLAEVDFEDGWSLPTLLFGKCNDNQGIEGGKRFHSNY